MALIRLHRWAGWPLHILAPVCGLCIYLYQFLVPVLSERPDDFVDMKNESIWKLISLAYATKSWFILAARHILGPCTHRFESFVTFVTGQGQGCITGGPLMK